jgi:hypothetical protein
MKSYVAVPALSIYIYVYFIYKMGVSVSDPKLNFLQHSNLQNILVWLTGYIVFLGKVSQRKDDWVE